MPPSIRPLTVDIFNSRNVDIYRTEVTSIPGWEYGLVVEQAEVSQYDAVRNLCRNGIELPDRLFCFAGAGKNFHGQQGRNWVSPPGNIYLTVHFAPNMKIDNFGVGFSILSAVSVVETIDSLPGLSGKAGIKWVNDIFIEKAKVSGFIAYSQNAEGVVTAIVIGIGLNVEAKPHVPASPFVPSTTTLFEHTSDRSLCTRPIVFRMLLENISKNYFLLRTGGYRQLLDIYRHRSIIIGKEVSVIPEGYGANGKEIKSGVVERIGDNLELFIKGSSEPIIRGRLILRD